MNISGGFFLSWGPMYYQAFTNDSLTMMYEGVRGALAADDALKLQEDCDIDVVTDGDFIPAGNRVQVIEIEGNRIVVKEV